MLLYTILLVIQNRVPVSGYNIDYEQMALAAINSMYAA